MARKYTAAIAGCGSIAHAHMEGYALVDEIDVIAVADPVETARRQYMEEYRIPHGFATVEEMMAAVKPDIVSVCVWHLLHAPMTVAAAQGGAKGIVCEKPMAIGMAEADRMVEVCETTGTKLVIGHQRRFTPGWEKARQLLRDGAIGEPLWVNCTVAEGLANWGTHAIDGARFVMDDPKTLWVMGAVERQTDRYERDTAIEDACMGLVQLERNIQLFVQSDLMREGASAGWFLIRGTGGLLDVSETLVRLMNAGSGGWTDVPLDMKEGDGAIGGNTHAAQMRELLAWLEGGPEHRGSGYKARDTVEIMMALYESARHHRVVRLPMEEKEYPLDLMIREDKLPVVVPGRYDIRAFLRRERIDEAAYAKLRAEGMGHNEIMIRLNQRQ
ncbi:MAG: Gfo/Idh/MocA family oxidoreductase [candidate division Zixibacteria bacterium]|nr:Gfo/Idh/MocA family oxidoreductase [candidate division Zixibacteria bacterium]